METDQRIRSWLATLKKLRKGSQQNKNDPEEVNLLIQDLEKFLEDDAKSKRKIRSLGKRVGNFVLQVAGRYGEHAVVTEILRWLMK